MTISILDMALNYELEGKKYYLTLAGKRLKTKKGNEIFTDSLVIMQKMQDDYKEYKFKSKWINLVSSYVDFLDADSDIQLSKDQLVSYLKNDLLLYLEDMSNEFFAYQEKTYLPLINKFEKILSLTEVLTPTTGLAKINFDNKTLELFNAYIEKLSFKDLFVSLFLTRITTSSILTTLYLSKNLTVEEFYDIAFYAELSKLKVSYDEEEDNRLKIIKQELDIINYLSRDGLNG